jgi:hypothetical protein
MDDESKAKYPKRSSESGNNELYNSLVLTHK